MKRIRRLSLYQKFALVFLCVGLLPLGILSTVIMNRMMKEYESSLLANYEQGAVYVNSGIDMLLDSCNDISKMPYYYNGTNEGDFRYNYVYYDNLRRILYGIDYDMEMADDLRRQNMSIFLRNVQSVDSALMACHFIADNEVLQESFHYSSRYTYLQDETLFRQRMELDSLDKASRNMMLIPTHPSDYYSAASPPVFTVARNYFDLTGPVGDSEYIGTIYADVTLDRMEELCRSVEADGSACVYVTDRLGNCFYSSDSRVIGQNLESLGSVPIESPGHALLETPYGENGLKVSVVLNTADALGAARQMRNSLFLILICMAAVLSFGAVFFSRRMTRPIRNMMEQMAQIENGNFKVQLPVESSDEIGVLSRRFNQMSQELETYIKKSYVAQLKQNEAELTALRSQIYPHFLYNTLEVIRMTALESNDDRVSRMIEALAQQIRYVIGTVRDFVPLEMEADIARKYIYLLNCRINGRIQLNIELDGCSERQVPKLILQPILENAYVHGIKPKNGSGSIMIDVELTEDLFVISVMDNGIGMDKDTLQKLHSLLDGDEIGIKNEHTWQSIGLKNVHDRIRYLYGEPYGLEITSIPGVGTTVRILMPVREERTEAEGSRENGDRIVGRGEAEDKVGGEGGTV